MAKCKKCLQRISIRTGKCMCNFESPRGSYNPARNDSSKWCPKCSCRVIKGKCMNAQCVTNCG